MSGVNGNQGDNGGYHYDPNHDAFDPQNADNGDSSSSSRDDSLYRQQEQAREEMHDRISAQVMQSINFSQVDDFTVQAEDRQMLSDRQQEARQQANAAASARTQALLDAMRQSGPATVSFDRAGTVEVDADDEQQMMPQAPQHNGPDPALLDAMRQSGPATMDFDRAGTVDMDAPVYGDESYADEPYYGDEYNQASQFDYTQQTQQSASDPALLDAMRQSGPATMDFDRAGTMDAADATSQEPFSDEPYQSGVSNPPLSVPASQPLSVPQTAPEPALSVPQPAAQPVVEPVTFTPADAPALGTITVGGGSSSDNDTPLDFAAAGSVTVEKTPEEPKKPQPAPQPRKETLDFAAAGSVTVPPTTPAAPARAPRHAAPAKPVVEQLDFAAAGSVTVDQVPATPASSESSPAADTASSSVAETLDFGAAGNVTVEGGNPIATSRAQAAKEVKDEAAGIDFGVLGTLKMSGAEETALEGLTQSSRSKAMGRSASMEDWKAQAAAAKEKKEKEKAQSVASINFDIAGTVDTKE